MSSSAVSRALSQSRNSSTSTRYARRVASASAGESRKRSAASRESTNPDSTSARRSLYPFVQCGGMRHGTKVWVALGTVYLIWGSTYLGIELAGETIPPLFAAGIRFTTVGVVLSGWLLARHGTTP